MGIFLCLATQASKPALAQPWAFLRAVSKQNFNPLASKLKVETEVTEGGSHR